MSVVMSPSVALLRYCVGLEAPLRRNTEEVAVGDVPLGGSYPIRLQSMTTTDTMDLRGTVQQVLRLVEAGAEYVRLTVPSQREAEQLALIKKALSGAGCRVPLVADVHFTPKAAEIAARYVEKIRINPGNYADKKRFAKIEYSDASYQAELERIADRFTPLVKVCKAEGRTMRIGTNHGSLSDRIMSRYGDTPLGMVESALEFLRICEELGYYDLVISMKASYPQVMLQAYRLLVQRLEEEGLRAYPLHLGVTEAGDGEDGRLKSALGIGVLLAEGLGDTIRVSLTEAPERELPVAIALRNLYAQQKLAKAGPLQAFSAPASFNPFAYTRRKSHRVLDWGAEQLPRVVSDASLLSSLSTEALISQLGYRYRSDLDKWESSEQASDYLYTGNWGEELPLPRGLRQVLHYKAWQRSSDPRSRYPLFLAHEINELQQLPEKIPTFLLLDLSQLPQLKPFLATWHNLVLWLRLSVTENYIALRKACFALEGISLPLGFLLKDREKGREELLLRAATDLGGCLTDGYGEGIGIQAQGLGEAREIAFGVLQAARLRLSRTEYIACPSCGRTLFDLEETTARIRSRTSHLKGLKIGIMGCIVNGPGEMADADYGYVGAGKNRINLYKGKEIIQRGVPTAAAVDALIHLIKADNKWQDPPQR